MRRLLTHLAQFSSLSTQGELLCTQGLAYLLENPGARAAFADFIAKRTGYVLGRTLTWRAEVLQPDGGRPDLEASTGEGTPVAKIEAKLGAALDQWQLRSYLDDLQQRSGAGLLLILVPARRASEATSVAAATFSLSGTAPWRTGDLSESVIGVISWEETLDALDRVTGEPFADDLGQFREMYRVFNGDVIEPITDDTTWRERYEVFVQVVDQVTRRLTAPGSRALPFGTDPDGYYRRYVCGPYGASGEQESSCFSVGVRDPFRGHTTPIWMRFTRTYAGFRGFGVIRENLRASAFWKGLVESGGHLWIPLELPLGVDFRAQVDSLTGKAQEVVAAVYRS